MTPVTDKIHRGKRSNRLIDSFESLHRNGKLHENLNGLIYERSFSWQRLQANDIFVGSMKHRLLKEVVRQLDRNCNCEQKQPYKLFCMIHLKKLAIQENNPFNNPKHMSPFATVRNVMKLQMELEEGTISEADFQKIADSLSNIRFGLWEDINEAIDKLINKEYQALLWP